MRESLQARTCITYVTYIHYSIILQHRTYSMYVLLSQGCLGSGCQAKPVHTYMIHKYNIKYIAFEQEYIAPPPPSLPQYLSIYLPIYLSKVGTPCTVLVPRTQTVLVLRPTYLFFFLKDKKKSG